MATKAPEEPQTRPKARLSAFKHVAIVTLSDFAEPSIAPHAHLYWGGTLPIIKALCEAATPDNP